MAAGGRAARGRDVMGSDHAPLVAACASWRREALGRTAGGTVTQRHGLQAGRPGTERRAGLSVPCCHRPSPHSTALRLSSPQIPARL